MYLSAFFLGGSLSLTACVSKQQYLEREADLLGDVQDQREQIDTLQYSLEAALRQGDDLRERIAQLEALTAEHEQGLEQLRGEKAQLLKDRTRLSASVEEMTSALEELQRRKRASEERVQAYRDLLDRFSSLIDAGKLQVRIVEGRMIVELATDILFASGSATLSSEGEEALGEVAEVLSTLDERRFQIEGHTDNVPIRTERFPSNWDLAAARAIVVTRSLVEGGLAPGSLSAASYAEQRPRADNDTEAGRAQNRRIEIVLIPDLSQLPGFDELSAIEAP